MRISQICSLLIKGIFYFQWTAKLLTAHFYVAAVDFFYSTFFLGSFKAASGLFSTTVYRKRTVIQICNAMIWNLYTTLLLMRMLSPWLKPAHKCWAHHISEMYCPCYWHTEISYYIWKHPSNKTYHTESWSTARPYLWNWGWHSLRSHFHLPHIPYSNAHFFYDVTTNEFNHHEPVYYCMKRPEIMLGNQSVNEVIRHCWGSGIVLGLK